MPENRASKPLSASFLGVLLGFVALTAVLAVIEVWTTIDPDGKVVLSSAVLAVATLLGLAGAARLDRQRRSLVGIATLVLAGLATFMMSWLIWFEPHDADWLLVMVGASWLWALTLALHSVVGLALLPKRWKWLKAVAALATYAGSALATAVLFAAFTYERVVIYTVLTCYIVAGLAAVAAAIMHWMRRPDSDEVQRLVLALEGEGVWLEVRNGRRFRVSEA